VPGVGKIGTEKPVLVETATAGGVRRDVMGSWARRARIGLWVVFGAVMDIGLWMI